MSPGGSTRLSSWNALLALTMPQHPRAFRREASVTGDAIESPVDARWRTSRRHRGRGDCSESLIADDALAQRAGALLESRSLGQGQRVAGGGQRSLAIAGGGSGARQRLEGIEVSASF